MQDNRPIYLQIADRICNDIVAGTLTAEGRVPSVRELAAESQVNVNTVVRTYEHLERDGVIFNRRGLGYFVAADAVERIKEGRRKLFFEGGEMDFIFARFKAIGLTPETVSELYSKYLGKV
ncbi:MAG: GntR family transcriptional regulator [Bacteroidales bacterium]|nr:GntR family transcriptional regulator [Bacteroidales bacterium]MBD5372826.1 GntR family transcriptional regulator [Bacteroides sp.]MDE6033883.1 GntR family transcriptional regulator [Muribaculaceae bacterium]